jgi:hypothetical protein
MRLHDLNTPPEIIDLVRQLAPKKGIGLDPCSNRTSMVGAKHEYGHVFDGGGEVFIDGLSMPWRGYGLVFMNPPHSMSPYNIEPWMEKAIDEFWAVDNLSPVSRRNDQFCGLVPAKVDTGWFHNYVVPHFHMVILEGRLKYWQNGHQTPGPGKFGSMLIYAGMWPEWFKAVFGHLGWCPE